MRHLNESKKRNTKIRLTGRTVLIAAAVLLIAAAAVAIVLLHGSKSKLPANETGISVTDSEPVGFLGTVENDTGNDEKEVYTVSISEVMPKNRATVCDADGDFPDYIELFNDSDKSVSLAGWKLSDKRGEGWAFPDVEIAPEEYLLVFADGKNILSGQLHTDFAVSTGETVFLYGPSGSLADSMTCTASQADTSCIRNTDGETEVTLYPSPGYPNSADGYIEWQESLKAAGPLVINEVMVANYTTLKYTTKTSIEYPDWVEIKNISSSPVYLSDYYLSDTNNDLKKWRFPERELEAGSSLIVICDPELAAETDPKYAFAGFSLNSQEEQLYVSSSSGLIDYMPLKDIPYGCSFGRVSGQNGFFYLPEPTPLSANSGGFRYIAPSPVCLTAEGVYEDTDSIEVELTGAGRIYYTLDGTVPTAESQQYNGPITVSKTTIIRAVSVIDGAMNSRPATFSYFLNENCSLPVVSLVVDDYKEYIRVCKWIDKTVDLPANIALFEDGGTFNLGCTVKITGQASLEEYLKKGMRVKFSGAFGQDKLIYDLFGEGEKEYGMLSIRTGNDNGRAYIRNELCQSLAYDFAPDMISQHGKYCVVFINGEYYGIFCLKEKVNEQYIADCAGVSKSSLETQTVENIRLYGEMIPLYNDVFAYAMFSDMSKQTSYEHIASQIDIDNFIDWYVIQGYTGNWDIIYRNVTFYRSAESDYKWRIALYDLDHTFEYHEYAFNNTYRLNYNQSPMAQLLSRLLKNDEFKEQYLDRVATALTTVFTNENTLGRIDELEQIILPEVERDSVRWGRTLHDYNYHMKVLKTFIQQNKIDYGLICRNNICLYLNITDQELMSHAQ